MATAKTNPLEVLATLTLEEVDARIAELQAALDDHVKRLGGEIDSLKVIRRAVDLRVNGKPEPVKRGPKAKKPPGAAPASPSLARPSLDGTVKLRVERYLRGPGRDGSKPAVIASAVDASYQSVYDALHNNDELFFKDGDGKWFLREAA